MSNPYWGRKFGGFWNPIVPKNHKDPWGWCIQTSKFGSHHTNTGQSKNHALSLQAKRDKEAHQKFIEKNGGPRIILYRSNGRRDHTQYA